MNVFYYEPKTLEQLDAALSYLYFHHSAYVLALYYTDYSLYREHCTCLAEAGYEYYVLQNVAPHAITVYK